MLQKDAKYLKFDEKGNIVGWRFYLEAKDLLGGENMEKLRQAGLQVLPKDSELDNVLDSSVSYNSIHPDQ